MNTDTLFTDIIAYENGDLTDEECIALFQRLIDTGLAWTLQGSYGRLAIDLMNAGYCTPFAEENRV